ncbi:hypothetical protein [Flavonifractor plautii]|uniref:hypothetical protein n=1 Tax=Flavonifractor plautii TaxID=292800 RepID=UPI003EEE3923
MTAYALSKFIGVNTTTTTNWKNRGTDPPAKYIAPICEFLGCSVSYFLTGSDTEPETKRAPALEISENGREMLALYEKLPEREQVLLLGRLQEMTAPLLGETKKRDQAEAASSGGRAG